MLRLRPYKACDAEIITAWLKSEYAFRQWSADRYDNYPICADDMNMYYDKERNNANLFAMTAFDETGPVGHFTMRYPQAENLDEVRLGFVIVDDKKRGMGYGKEMVALAVQYAFDFLKVKKVSLGVFENNQTALHCYRACGFTEVSVEKTESYLCMGETWNCIEMEHVYLPNYTKGVDCP